MRRLFFTLFFAVTAVMTPFGASAEGGTRIIAAEGENEIEGVMTFAVFTDSACRKPLQKDGSDVVVRTDEKGRISEELKDSLYLKQTGGPPGYYLSREVIPAAELKKKDIRLEMTQVLYCISAEKPWPAKYIYDEKGNPADEEALLPGRKYYVSADSEEEWKCWPAVVMEIPLYDEGIVEIELQEGTYSRISMGQAEGVYAVYSDAECRKQARDIHGAPAAVSGEKPADLPAGTYRLKQSSDEGAFFPDETIYEIQTEEGKETLFSPEQKALRLQVRAVDQNGEAVSGKMICAAADSEGRRTTAEAEAGKAEMLLYHPDTYEICFEDLPAGYVSAGPVSFAAERELTEEGAEVIVPLQSFDLRIRIRDDQTEASVAGASLRLTDSEGNIAAEWLSSDDPAGDIPLLEGKKVRFHPGQSLRLDCTGSADHYLIQPDEQISLPQEITEEAVSVSVPARRYVSARLRILDEQGDAAEGGRAAFYEDSACTKPAEDIYGEQAEISSDEKADLFPGTYFIRLTESPQGCYQSDEVSEVHLNESGICIVQCRHVSVNFILKDAVSGEVLNEGILCITDQDGNICGEIDCGGSGRNDFLLQADTDYNLSVTQAPSCHLPPEETSFHTGLWEDTEAELECQPYISLQVVLRDESGEIMEDGAVSLYSDPECSAAALDIRQQRVSGSGGLQADLFGGTYYLKEDEAPSSCYPPEAPLEIFLDPSLPGTFTAERIYESASAAVRCVDEEDGRSLSGSHIAVFDQKGNMMTEGEMSGEEMILSCRRDGLKTGETYTLKVTEPSYMHIVRENEISFEIPPQKPEEPLILTITETPYAAVLIQKKGGSSGLPDVQYAVFADRQCTQAAYDVSGRRAEGKTDGNGEILWYLAAGDYWLKEADSSSHWYSSKEPVQITVSPVKEPSLRIISEAQEASFLVSVSDPEGNLLTGAKIEVYDEGEELVSSFTSSGEPYLLNAEALRPEGVYTVHQASAAEGYQVNSTDIEFVMPETAPVQTPLLTIRNERLPSVRAGRKLQEKPSFPVLPVFAVFSLMTAAGILLYRRFCR